MNLVENQWVPVIGSDGRNRLASLAEIFKEGEHIADLAANPCQRIALMRLLICIAQAALDGPADEDDWRECRTRLGPAALNYLARWRDRFNLFGDDAFLQVDGLEMPDSSFMKSPSTLDATSTKGGTGLSGLWDHAADNLLYSKNDVTLPLFLLCYVNFSCSGKVGKARWRGDLFNGSTAAGASHNYLHTYLLGDTLLETLFYNLVPRDLVISSVVMGDENNWGVPVWELMPRSPGDSKAMLNAARTFLGRLVPLSRLVKFTLLNDEIVECTIGPPPDGLRMERLPFLREPAATVVLQENTNEGKYLPARAGRHVWRDLEAILATGHEGGTLSIVPFFKEFVYSQKTERFRIWTGGSVRGKNEGKYDDLIEWCTDLDTVCFLDRSLTAYRNGILRAEQGKKSLFDALLKYSNPNKDLPKKDKRQIPFATAESQFWNILDRNLDVLFNVQKEQTVIASEYWTNRVKVAMREAYARTCPHETPRQIEAYARGLKILNSWRGDDSQASPG